MKESVLRLGDSLDVARDSSSRDMCLHCINYAKNGLIGDNTWVSTK